MDDLDSLYHTWLRLDKNPHTRTEIIAFREQNNVQELRKRLCNRIAFGTAGLRAPMAAGFSCMNDLTVLQATQGVCAHLLNTVPDTSSRGVVIGFDHRHNSERFARLTAATFLRNGVKVFFFPSIVCTPMVPFTISRNGAAAGIMITASHNPAQDNGYKVYWSNAVQISPPLDSEIAAEIENNLEVPTSAWEHPQIFIDSASLLVDPTESALYEYMEHIQSLSYARSTNYNTKLRFVYTAMHGAGYNYVKAALRAFDFPLAKFLPVPEQQHPDPDFPTVSFPNPEEKGALDRAIAFADQERAELVLATDPDVDRFCAAEKQKDRWVAFTGDQMGVILGCWILQKIRSNESKSSKKIAMIASTVSSKMLEAVAKKEGFRFEETLTGFKYIGKMAKDIVSQSSEYIVPFGYEEAIGYMCSEEIRDKDGVSALVICLEMAAELQKQEMSLFQYLESLYAKYGYFASRNSYMISKDPSVTDKAFNALRWGSEEGVGPNPEEKRKELKIPKTMNNGKIKITSIRDLTVGYDDSYPENDYRPTLDVSPSTHMISFTAEYTDSNSNTVKVQATVRTSGTEPKIKYYLEGTCSSNHTSNGGDNGSNSSSSSDASKKLVDEVLVMVENGLCEEWLQRKVYKFTRRQ